MSYIIFYLANSRPFLVLVRVRRVRRSSVQSREDYATYSEIQAPAYNEENKSPLGGLEPGILELRNECFIDDTAETG